MHGMVYITIVCLVNVLVCPLSADMNVATATDGSYSVIVDSSVWLHSAPTFFQSNGKMMTTENDSLKMVCPPSTTSGQDTLGAWTAVNYTYDAGSADKQSRIDVYIRSYKDHPAVVFSQLFRDGVEKSTVGDKNKVISAFPAFQVKGDGHLGYLDYGGLFAGWVNLTAGQWGTGRTNITDGLEGGPLALFDRNGNAVVISAFNQFMASSMWYDRDSGFLNWGIMGGIDSVPAGYLVEFIIYYSGEGINQAMSGWGSLLRKWYRKDAQYRYEDPSVQYIGYYTDNGGYYYHKTEPGMNYEETMLGVLKYARKQGIPYRYLQYDDWWYPIAGKGYGATVTWDAMPSVFPHGLRYLFNKTMLPVVAHNRYWSNTTTYAKQNGGPFNFIMDKDKSLPVEQAFWDYLFSTSIQWGLAVYEQDWLDRQTEQISQLSKDLYIGREWLTQMGEAAARYGIRIQYCMALPKNVLQSLEIQAVTQIRVSIDYLLRSYQWRIGISSMFADAVGLAPFKDNFWTIGYQPGNPYKLNESYVELEAVVSLLSTGPVGPSDRIGYSNKTLIAKLHAADGLLLKPSKPATAIDEQILQMAFGGQIGPVGEVWSTYSDISGQRFGVLFAADLQSTYYIGPTKAGFGKQFSRSFVYSYKFNAKQDKPEIFSDGMPLKLSGCSKLDFCLYYTTPVHNWRGLEVMILGELDKFIPVSPQRVLSISSGDNDFKVTLAGSPGELVTFYISLELTVSPVVCKISDLGKAILSLAHLSCYGL